MLIPSINNIILKIKHKYISNITDIMRVAAMENNSLVQQADYVNIVGEVVAVPMEVSVWRREYAGYSVGDIRVGDTAIFSHDVIYSFVPTELEKDPVYKNSFWYNGAEYWRCNILSLYAVIRDGEIRMQNGFIMVERIDVPPKLFISNHTKKTMGAASALVTNIGEGDSISRGDVVYFSPNKLRLYQIGGKPFGIIKRSHVLGRMANG